MPQSRLITYRAGGAHDPFSAQVPHSLFYPVCPDDRVPGRNRDLDAVWHALADHDVGLDGPGRRRARGSDSGVLGVRFRVVFPRHLVCGPAVGGLGGLGTGFRGQAGYAVAQTAAPYGSGVGPLQRACGRENHQIPDHAGAGGPVRVAGRGALQLRLARVCRRAGAAPPCRDHNAQSSPFGGA